MAVKDTSITAYVDVEKSGKRKVIITVDLDGVSSKSFDKALEEYFPNDYIYKGESFPFSRSGEYVVYTDKNFDEIEGLCQKYQYYTIKIRKG